MPPSPGVAYPLNKGAYLLLEGGRLLGEGAYLCFGGAFFLGIVVQQQGQKVPSKCPQGCQLCGVSGCREFSLFVAFSAVAAEDRGPVSVSWLPEVGLEVPLNLPGPSFFVCLLTSLVCCCLDWVDFVCLLGTDWSARGL